MELHGPRAYHVQAPAWSRQCTARSNIPMESLFMQQNITRCEGYSFTLVNIDCLRDSTHFNIIMDLDASVEDLFPYLAARLVGCTYTHGTGFINLMDAGHIVSIHHRQLTITDVTDDREARNLCSKYFAWICDVRSSQSSIEPVFRKRSTITVMDIFRALPKTNCGVCESASCLAFAAKVFRREECIDACKPLQENPELCQELMKQLGENGYLLP
jgi:ArsR family metal-binding transcriptional regulator